MGLAIFDSMYNTDVLSGPNARHNVFGLFYFGAVGGTVYSFILGWLVGFIRNKMYFLSGKGAFGLAFYVSLAYYATYIEQDFSGMAMMYLFSFGILFPVLCFISTVLYKGSKQLYEKNDSLILLATYNGEKYIKESLDSFPIEADIFVSDDCSSDSTVSIIRECNGKQITIKEGLRHGSAARNFCYMINECSALYNYYFLADQDDCWTKDKYSILNNEMVALEKNMDQIYLY